jgi:2-hydroxychromene-2-carboxylate isomerase
LTQPVFYFGAMSPYSWLAAERIGEILPGARWQGVLAGVIFQANGRTSWGLTDEREQGLAACEARAAERGLGPIRWPEGWPSSDLIVTRAMLHAEREGVLEPFALAAMRLGFLQGRSVSELETVLDAAAQVGLDPAAVEQAISEQELKDRLRAVNDEALALGVFGVPTVVVDGELFWGDDRLELAAAAAVGSGSVDLA